MSKFAIKLVCKDFGNTQIIIFFAPEKLKLVIYTIPTP
jgi:hypothetical protein